MFLRIRLGWKSSEVYKGACSLVSIIMKRVSILIPTIDSGGAEKQAVLLAVQLSKHTTVNLIVLYGNHSEYELNVKMLTESDVIVHKLSGNIFSKICTINTILKNTKTEVLLNYLTLPNVLGSIIGRTQGIKVYNGIRSSRLPRAKMLAERIVHNRFATGTIFNCYSGLTYFQSKGFNAEKNIVIPNCFNNIAPAMNREDRALKRIITVGRFDSSKDYETLISSISMLKRDDFMLCIVGYGVLEDQIRSWVKQYGIEDKTEIHIKPNNVAELERGADIYLSSSVFEGTSNSIMEALNWSLPVVATDVGDNDHLIINGENGFLHSVGDAKGLSSSVSRLLDSIELRNQMGVKGNQLLQQDYSMGTFEQRYIRLIEE